MTELLKKWAELEPERLSALAGGGAYFEPPIRSTVNRLELEHTPVARAIVLAAVIEAIEARLGGWRLEASEARYRPYTPTSPAYHATVWWRFADQEEATAPFHHETRPGATPAAALLTAYLAALEAEAGQ